VAARCRKFLADQAGAVAPIFALALIALLAAGALAWDVSRSFALRAELDAAVDAAALAGATQLDGADGSRDRAEDAARSALVTNGQRLADTAQADAVTGATITFLQDLTDKTAADTDANARYIQVELAPKQLSPVLGAFAGLGVVQAKARAIAGYTMALCSSPPIYVCAPGGSAFNPDDYIGHTVPLQADNGSGNWGFIDIGAGADDIKEAMGSGAPGTECISLSPLPKPGNVTSADDWLNTRFDIYRGGAGGLSGDANYAPAQNTIIGYRTASNCAPSSTGGSPDLVIRHKCPTVAAETYSGGMGLPIDCNQDPTTTSTAVWGNGQWQAAEYFLNNHSGGGYPSTMAAIAAYAPGGGSWSDYGPNATGGAVTPTRYQVYNWELAMLGKPAMGSAIAPPSWAFNQSQQSSSGTRDAVNPTCNTTTTTQPTRDRRTFTAAIAACPVNGTDPVQITGFMDLFLVYPAAGQQIYAEVIGKSSEQSNPGKDSLVRRVVLYE
jgi:Flp pilus assembly protein TadG